MTSTQLQRDFGTLTTKSEDTSTTKHGTTPGLQRVFQTLSTKYNNTSATSTTTANSASQRDFRIRTLPIKCYSY